MAQSRVVFDNASNLTTGQQNQLNTDRQIRATREANAAASSLANIGKQNEGQLERETLSQAGQTERQGMANNALIDSTNIKETAETGRNTLTNTSAMDRLVAGNVHATETAKIANDNITAADHRKTAGAALLAGADPAQLGNALNPHHGMPVDFSGVKVPLKNSQQDNFQFINQPADPTTRTPAAMFVGNKQTGQLANASTAAAALAGNPGQQQAPSPTGGAEAGAEAGQGNRASDAFSEIYKQNPQRLQDDAAFAVAQVGTVHKTDAEQEAYLLAMRKSNPELFKVVHPMLKQQLSPANK